MLNKGMLSVASTLLNNSVFSFTSSLCLGVVGIEVMPKVSAVCALITTVAACLTALIILIYWGIKAWVAVSKFIAWCRDKDSDFE